MTQVASGRNFEERVKVAASSSATARPVSGFCNIATGARSSIAQGRLSTLGPSLNPVEPDQRHTSSLRPAAVVCHAGLAGLLTTGLLKVTVIASIDPMLLTSVC